MAIYKGREVNIVRVESNDDTRIRISYVGNPSEEEVVNLREIQMTKEEKDNYIENNPYSVSLVNKDTTTPDNIEVKSEGQITKLSPEQVKKNQENTQQATSKQDEISNAQPVKVVNKENK